MSTHHPPTTDDSRNPALRTVLWVDAGLEALIAAVLLVWWGTFADWLDIPRLAAFIAGLVFAVAAMGVSTLACRRTGQQFVSSLAWGNIFGGILGWAVIIVAWGKLAPEGRWILAAGSDSFALVGILELIAVRRSWIS